MKKIMCDASPLIFLAKLNLLSLVEQSLAGEVLVLQCVVDEVLTPKTPPLERLRLEAFIERATVIDFTVEESFRGTLSLSDQSTLSWAKREKADWLLADERLLRRVAKEEGLAVMGFLGLIIRAKRQSLLGKEEALLALNEAVSRHDCQISIQLYQRIIEELNKS